jgi:ribosomal protein S19E (S16A)
VRPNVGVGRLADIFGGKERNGSARKHHARDSRGVIRACMKALEKAGILMRYNDKRHKNLQERPTGDSKYYSRVVTPEGQKAINHIAGEVYKKIVSL